MKLCIAGICHFAPLGRNKLKEWIGQLAQGNTGPPAFVATEWDQTLFAQVKDQRGQFRQLAQKQWTAADADLLDVLETSLGYEADTHDEFFPNVEVLWLDQGRNGDVSSYAKGRLNVYRSFLDDEPPLTNTAEALEKLSQEAWSRAEQSRGSSTERDDKFASLLLDRISKGGSDWAIVIVGAAHARYLEKSICMQLDKQGHSCQVTILR
ncbi:MAG: hypothetical protein HY444_08110 [Nitrospirae bacterium]|nr:hypothetical protein [Nitrospirota bacterium]